MNKNITSRMNLANTLMGVGLLLVIVPLGFIVVTLITSSGLDVRESIALLGWAVVVVYALLPLGLGCFVGGLTWLNFLKRAKQKMEELLDEQAGQDF